MIDLFDMTPAAPPSPTPGIVVRLARSCDPCCCGSDLARIAPGTATHAAELRCASCDAHRGWLPKQALNFINETTRRYGAPAEPITLRDRHIGDQIMEDKKLDNSGILFRNN